MGMPHINWHNADALRTTCAEWLCPNGCEPGAYIILPAKKPHYGQARCLTCGTFHGFVQQPRMPAEQKARRQSTRPPLPNGEDFCWICDRDAATLKALGLRLQWAHKRDRAALINDGLEPDSHDELMRLCEECHRLVDHVRSSTGRIIRLLRNIGGVEPAPVLLVQKEQRS